MNTKKELKDGIYEDAMSSVLSNIRKVKELGLGIEADPDTHTIEISRDGIRYVMSVDDHEDGASVTTKRVSEGDSFPDTKFPVEKAAPEKFGEAVVDMEKTRRRR